MTHDISYKRYDIWLEQAKFDLEAAQISYENAYYEWACFQSEQSAEKALKGLLAYSGIKPPKMHKLSILYRYIKNVQTGFPHHIEMDALQAVTFISRYPFIVPGDNMTPHMFLTKGNASECIEEARTVLTAITYIISQKHEKKEAQ